MRIRNARTNDIPEIVQVEQQAALADGRQIAGEARLAALFEQGNMFVVTDDDDELNTWGQAGTLDGLGGPIAGYTTVTQAYNLLGECIFVCQGTVAPQYRRQNAGRLLLLGALNRARLLASEIEEDEAVIYFAAMLPVRDPISPQLAARFELLPAKEEIVEEGLQLYLYQL